MPFCHLIKYCKSKPSTIIAKTQKVTASTTGVNYKIRIQIPRGINNEIKLDKKNGNHLWNLLQFAIGV
jgi:hypothetical protein